MRHLIKNSILVVVSYSLALSSPAYAKPVDNFAVVKNYVNGGGKKNLKGLIEKMEGDLPTTFYEEALQKTRGANGKMWYQAAKLANNYIYVRFNNSKLFVRVTEVKGETVFYANGIKITDNDFRNQKTVQNKLYLAYVAGLPARKTSMLDFLEFTKSFAGDEVAPADRVDTGPIYLGNTGPANNCDVIIASITRSLQESPPDMQSVSEQCQNEAQRCDLQSVCNNRDAVVAGPGGANTANNRDAVVAGPGGANTANNRDKIGLMLFGLFALFILFKMLRGKKKKAPETPVVPEVPEDENGVGRTPPVTGGVNCGGNGAQCPGTGTPTPVPGTYSPGAPSAPPTTGTPVTPPTTGAPVSSDPNYYGMPSNDANRPL
jgi:hypothetical protein